MGSEGYGRKGQVNRGCKRDRGCKGSAQDRERGEGGGERDRKGKRVGKGWK